MKYLVVYLLLYTIPLQAQWRDKCPDFIIHNKKSYNGIHYGPQFNHSVRHSQWQYAIDAGLSTAIHTGGPSYSRINLQLGAKIRLSDHWITHQDMTIQLHDRSWDTLFHTGDIGLELGADVISIGYEYWDHPILGYSYIGFGTGIGETFTRGTLPLVWVIKSRKGITDSTYFEFKYFWNFNDFFNMYDDNILIGVGTGWYLDQKSKYKK